MIASDKNRVSTAVPEDPEHLPHGRNLPVNRTLACIALLVFLAAGCQNKGGGSVPMNESVTDIGGPPAGGYQQPTPVAAQPVVYDSVATPREASPADSVGGSMAAGSYTVKKGDTLYGIARQRYGNGNQWTRIAEANPGLTPQSLKAGQTISIP
jgi:phage tail protein X